MPNNKKHHYVPRFYLKRFSADGKSIHLYNLKSGRTVHHANLSNQCYRDYFYGRDQKVEHALGESEGMAADLFRAVDEVGVLPPNGTHGFFLFVIYLAMQSARTTHSAEVVNEMSNAFMQHMLGPEAEARGWDLSKVKIGIKDPAVFALQAALEGYPLLLDLECKLLLSAGGQQFVTSDNPIVMYNQFFFFRTFVSNTGMPSKGLQIFFPLGPGKVAFLYDADVYRVGNRKQSVIEIRDPRDLHEINALQMCSASANVYFSDKDANLDALYAKAKPFLRQRKSNFRVFPGETTPEGRSEYLATSQEDVRTNLSLSFVRVRKSAKRWRDAFREQREQPAVVVRDRKIMDAHREFFDRVRKGELQPSQFFEFLATKN